MKQPQILIPLDAFPDACLLLSKGPDGFLVSGFNAAVQQFFPDLRLNVSLESQIAPESWPAWQSSIEAEQSQLMETNQNGIKYFLNLSCFDSDSNRLVFIKDQSAEIEQKKLTALLIQVQTSQAEGHSAADCLEQLRLHLAEITQSRSAFIAAIRFDSDQKTKLPAFGSKN